MSDLENGATEVAPEVETVTTATEAPAPEATQTEPTAEDLDAELASIYTNAKPPRGEDGKFAPRNPQEPAETVSEDQPQEEAVETAKPSIDPPISWSSEVKEKWASLPPDVQEYVARRESETHRAITSMGQQVKAFEPIAHIIQSNQDVFTSRNTPIDQGLAQLIKAQRLLDSDPAGFVSAIANRFSVDLRALAGMESEPGNQHSPQVNALQAQLQSALHEVQQLKSLVMTREQREAQARANTAQQTAQEFLAKNPLSEDLEDALAREIEFIKFHNPDLSPKELLDRGFERFRTANPQIRAQEEAAKRAAEDAKRAKEAAAKATDAKRASSINVRSTPGASRSARSEDEELREIWARSRSA